MVIFRRQSFLFISLAVATLTSIAISAQNQGQNRGQQAPARDTSAQRTTADTTPPAKGRIAGRVLTADTGRPVRLAASFGVATYPDDARDLETLLALGDQALFSVKDSGRDGIALAGGRF
jgi:GGDEF domain-containing protein